MDYRKLLTQPYLIFTTEKGQHKIHKPIRLEEAKAALKVLGDANDNIVPLRGKYGDEEQQILVSNPTPKQQSFAEQMAYLTGQDAFLTSDGKDHTVHYHPNAIHQNGPNKGQKKSPLKGAGVQFHDKEPADVYNVLPDGTIFTHIIGEEPVQKSDPSIKMPVKEFVEEHRKLLNVLKHPTKDKLKDEIKEQGGELKELGKSSLEKSKNVREQRKRVFGTSGEPNPDRKATKPFYDKQAAALNTLAQKRYGMPLAEAKGKYQYDLKDVNKMRAKEGKAPLTQQEVENHPDYQVANKKVSTLDPNNIRLTAQKPNPKPDWRSGELQAQRHVGAKAHELGHLEISPEQVPLGDLQTVMDVGSSVAGSKFQGMPKQTEYEVQPMAAEELLRRRAGIPQFGRPQYNDPRRGKGTEPLTADSPQRTTLDTKRQYGKRFTDPKGQLYDLVGMGSNLNAENKQRMQDVDQGILKFHPEKGWHRSNSPDALVNLRGRGDKASADELARKKYQKSEPMAKGKNGDWNKDGYSFKVIPHEDHPEFGGEAVEVQAHHPKFGHVGGTLVRVGESGEWEPAMTEVLPEHRRKGLANQMYKLAENHLGESLLPNSNQSKDAQRLWDSPNRTFGKSENLIKGSRQRKMPFNPLVDQPEGDQLERIHIWQGGAEGSRKHRDAIQPAMGTVRDRFLHKLSANTKVRRAKDGGREFLLHRGMQGARLLPAAPLGTSHETHSIHDRNSSWTPHYKIAHQFAFNTDTQQPDNLESAWIHENKILTVPKQYGNVPSGAGIRNANAFSNEHEVIVAPHVSEKAPFAPHYVDEVHPDINARITQRGQKGYAHFQTPEKVLQQRQMGKADLKKAPMIAEQPLMSRPHMSSKYEGMDNIKTFDAGKFDVDPNDINIGHLAGKPLYHHVYKRPDYEHKSGKASYLHALSIDPDPWGDTGILISSSVSGGSKGDDPDNSLWAPNHPWKPEDRFASIGETIARPGVRGRGLGKRLYQHILGYHGKLASDTSVSPAAQKVWENLSTQPNVKAKLAPTSQKDVHWAETSQPYQQPINTIDYGGKSQFDIERMGKAELKKGRNGDWKKEGYTFKHIPGKSWFYNKNGEQILDTTDHVIKAFDSNGNEAGHYEFDHNHNPEDEHVHPRSSTTMVPHQRKGLANEAYRQIEEITGAKIKRPTLNQQTDSAKALWSQSNRHFGKSQLKKAPQLMDQGHEFVDNTFRQYRFEPNYHIPVKTSKLKDGKFYHIYKEPEEDGRVNHAISASSNIKDSPLSLISVSPNSYHNGESDMPRAVLTATHEPYQGQGLGTRLKALAVKHHGKLLSDAIVSEPEHNSWLKFKNAPNFKLYQGKTQYQIADEKGVDYPEAGEEEEASQDPHIVEYRKQPSRPFGKSLQKGLSPEELKNQGYRFKLFEGGRFGPTGAGIIVYHGRNKVGHLAFTNRAYGAPHSETDQNDPRWQREGYFGAYNSEIHPDHRGKGIYQHMLGLANQHAKSKGGKGLMSEGYQRSGDATRAWDKVASHANPMTNNRKVSGNDLSGDQKARMADYFMKKEKPLMKPYSSEAQRRWAHTQAGMKALGGESAVHEWDQATKGKKLPERIKKSQRQRHYWPHEEDELYKNESLQKNRFKDLAHQYANSKGLALSPDMPNVSLNPEHGKMIAEAYHNMKHDPNHPDVKAAYGALVNETGDQFKHLLGNGLKISKIQPGQENPYKSSKDLFNDLHNNNHMWYYPTDLGFGSHEQQNDHPLLQPTQFVHDGQKMPANDVFRVVHDAVHAIHGSSFGPKGEHQTYSTHRQMYSPLAQKALATETMGQNSWVNFGPHAAHNRANPAETIFADQKAGLLPDHISSGNWHGPAPEPVKKSQILKKFARFGVKLK